MIWIISERRILIRKGRIAGLAFYEPAHNRLTAESGGVFTVWRCRTFGSSCKAPTSVRMKDYHPEHSKAKMALDAPASFGNVWPGSHNLSWRNSYGTSASPAESRRPGPWSPSNYLPILITLPDPVHCEERERLISLHVAAVARHNEADQAVAEPKSEGGREARQEAMKQTRRVCRETLADLNRHRAEHGC
jgi:hypothetical protein